jgi:hypothetical protein
MQTFPIIETPKDSKRIERYQGLLIERSSPRRARPYKGGEIPSIKDFESGDRRPRNKRRTKHPTIVALAAESVLELSHGGAAGDLASSISRLRQAVRRDAGLRPRHAAVALALADALSLVSGPLTVQQREAIRRAAQTMLDTFISVADERGVLTALARARLDRLPPLDEGPLASVLD